MFAQVVLAAGAIVIGIIGLGTTLGITSLFLGHSVNEHGLFLLVVPMAGISVFASFGRSETFAAVEVIVIFAFVGAAMVFSNVAGPVMLLLLFAGYLGLYGLPCVRAWNYLLVRRPLEQAALRQQTLSLKLDADTGLAEAALRHERARAALADAERALEEAERGGRVGGRA
jgi:hypothetical protein